MLQNLDKIYVGQVFKDMKDLFRYVGFIGLYDGNSRLAKEKCLKQYLSWKRIDGTRRIVITEIKQR